MAVFTAEVEEVDIIRRMLLLVRPKDVEDFHLFYAVELKRLAHACCDFIATHFTVLCREEIRFNNAVAHLSGVGRTIVFQHNDTLALDGVVEATEVFRHLVVNTVLRHDVEIIERGEFLAQMSHLRRIVDHGIEHLIDGDGFIVAEVDAVGDFQKEGRFMVKIIPSSFLMHNEAHAAEGIDITIN